MAVLGDVEAAAPGGGFKGGKKVAGKRPASASAARKKPQSTATKPQPASRPQSAGGRVEPQTGPQFVARDYPDRTYGPAGRKPRKPAWAAATGVQAPSSVGSVSVATPRLLLCWAPAKNNCLYKRGCLETARRCRTSVLAPRVGGPGDRRYIFRLLLGPRDPQASQKQHHPSTHATLHPPRRFWDASGATY